MSRSTARGCKPACSSGWRSCSTRLTVSGLSAAGCGRSLKRPEGDIPTMSVHGLALFCLAYLLASAAPGPGIAAIVARVLGRGAEGIIAFLAGYVAGDLVWFSIAATGMAVLAQTAHTAFMLVKYAGAAYLFYLAWRLWAAPARPLAEEAVPERRGAAKLF